LFSIITNLTILGFFKYYNFFIASLESLLSFANISISPPYLNIILPVGISFYTFQTMSYTIDIYRGRSKPTHHFLDFALFVAFFPQLVAGPIERARRLLPQISKPRQIRLEQFYEGSFLIAWGYFLKVFVADNLVILVDSFFSQQGPYNGVNILFAFYAFAPMLLCDFAGYSNIARGLGKLMGFELMVNFNLPYFSTNPRDFWKRWHISFMSWIRDYVYQPLKRSIQGKKGSQILALRNLLITFVLVFLWHGANWTFILCGVYFGLMFGVYVFVEPYLKRIPVPKIWIIEKGWFLFRVFVFYHLWCLSGALFLCKVNRAIRSIASRIIF